MSHQAANNFRRSSFIRQSKVRSGHRAVVDHRLAFQNADQAAHSNIVLTIGIIEFVDLHVQVLHRAAHNTEEANGLIACSCTGFAAVHMAHGVALTVKRASKRIGLTMVTITDGCPDSDLRQVQVCAQDNILARIAVPLIHRIGKGFQLVNVGDNIGVALGAVCFFCVLQRVLHSFLDCRAALRCAGDRLYIINIAVIAQTEQLLDDGNCLRPIAFRLILFGHVNAADVAVLDRHSYRDRNRAVVALCRAGIRPILVGAGRRLLRILFKQSGDRDFLGGHREGIGSAGQRLVPCHQRLEVITCIGLDRQRDRLALGGGGLICGHGTVLHGCNGDTIAFRRRGGAGVQNHVIHSHGTIAAVGRLKHKRKLCAVYTEGRGNRHIALAGDIFHRAVLVHGRQVLLRVPNLRPGLALVLRGFHSELDGTAAQLFIRTAEIEGQRHTALHLDLRQDEFFVLLLLEHNVLRADGRIAAVQRCVPVDLPSVVILGTRAINRPASRKCFTVVKILVNAVRQNYSLLRKGRCDGMVFAHVANGVSFHGTLRDPVHLHVLDLIVVRGLDGKGLAAALFHRHCAARRDAATLPGGSSDGEGGRLDRRTAAAGGGELYVVHKDGATILAICGTLITEGQLRGIARHFNCHISGSNIAIDNTIGQLIKMLFCVPNLAPVLTVRRGFDGNCHIPIFQVNFVACKLECQSAGLAC